MRTAKHAKSSDAAGTFSPDPAAESPARAAASAVHLLTIRVPGATTPEQLAELRTWREEQLLLTPTDPKLARKYKTRIQQRYFTEYDRLLDQNREVETLINRRLAALIRRELYRRQSDYRLLAYAIMPNHVHVVLEALSGSSGELDAAAPAVPDCMDERADINSPLVDYLRGLKQSTAAAAAALEGGAELAWHGDSFDYWVRSSAELEAIVDYLAHNPVSAGLVRAAEQWFFCSAHDRFLHDGETCGWLPEVVSPPILQ
jgi:REP element-mobilizing transposase RayT